ncbi:MAG: carboxypeptidase-like regulatory domain-containing protein [Candidatus Sulfotelmatobacter sp.]
MSGMDRNLRDWLRAVKWVLVSWISVIGMSSSLSAIAQSQQVPLTGVPEASASAPLDAPSQPQLGKISGTVVDPDGAVIANVKIIIAQQGVTSKRGALSDGDGHFALADVAPGPFQLSLTASGFAPLEKSGVLRAGEDYVIPQIALVVAPADVDVEVTVAPEQVAEDQVKAEEKQRLLGVFPNFYVSYVPDAVPLTTKLKFQLAWKSTVDPVSFGIVGAVAGIEQADNTFSGYGQGAQGYAKRYGAAYADLVSGTFIGSAILPSLLKQDPRYFIKGTGSRQSRVLYAIANSVICKGDNRHWQPNYSFIIGDLAAGGISNLYYPAQNRNGAALTFENALIAIGGGAIGNVIQEFFLRKITPHVPPQDSAKPSVLGAGSPLDP